MKIKLTFILTLMICYGAIAQYAILVQPAGSKEWGYAGLNGEMIIDAKYKKCIGFSEDGYAAIYDGKIKQFYFIDLKGEILETEIKDFKLIEIFGFGMKGFQDGMAPVKVKEKWGFIDINGKLAIPAIYDKVTVFRSGFASVQRDGKFFAVDKSGTEFQVDVPGVEDLNDFSEQLASYKTSADLVGFVDGAGKVVVEAQFKAAGDYYGGLAWAKNTAGKVGFINTAGEWVIEPIYDAGKNFDPVSGLVRVKTADKWGYVNKSGEVMFMNDSDLFEDFTDGLARGRKNGKFGYFNPAGEWAIQPQFDGARDFKNGYASVKVGSLWGVIDQAGAWVIQPKFDDIKDVEKVTR